MIYRKKVRLGDLLVQKGIITEEQLSEALKAAERKETHAWRDDSFHGFCLTEPD